MKTIDLIIIDVLKLNLDRVCIEFHSKEFTAYLLKYLDSLYVRQNFISKAFHGNTMNELFKDYLKIDFELFLVKYGYELRYINGFRFAYKIKTLFRD